MRYLLGLTCFMFLGCGGGGDDQWTKDRPEVVAASGTVTYNNEPVEGATVVFVPVNGSNAASGVTDSSGQFTVSAFPNAEGAVPGSYKVTITKTEAAPTSGGGGDAHGEAAVAPKNLLPPKYGDAQSTPLTADVPADGKTDLQFELTD